MAEITASLVKELREKTGAGMMDCKKALNEVQGDLEKAIDWLRTKGLSAAAKKAGRVAAEGLVGVAANGTRGAVVEVNAETDFVGRNEQFQKFVGTVTRLALESNGDKSKLGPLGKQLAMHVAAANPQSLTVADLDKAAIERERAVLAEKAGQSGKGTDIIAKMVEGGLRKFHQEVVLLEQAFVMDGKTKVSKVVDDAAKQVGAPVRLAGFLRSALGEGIEKKSEDFAAEVAAQLKKQHEGLSA